VTCWLQDATADDANAADDDLYLINQRLTAALDGTRQELFDVYQRVPDILSLLHIASHQPLSRIVCLSNYVVAPDVGSGSTFSHAC
jgi:hypothetical protein